MDQFISDDQSYYYNLSRPKYTEEIFYEIISDHKSENGNDLNSSKYLDIACGTGQLLIPISRYFQFSVGVDISESQINQAKINLDYNLNSNNVHLYICNCYDVMIQLKKDHLIESENADNIKLFDLITVGQAFHWFDELEFLYFTKSILKDGGYLVLTGYQKQHFDKTEQPQLFRLFEKTISTLKPYFECDVENNDNAYSKSIPNIQKVFGTEIEIKFYKEQLEVSIGGLLSLINSWSAYINFKKIYSSIQDDPIYELKEGLRNLFREEIRKLEEIKLKYYNFYFTIKIKN